LVRRRWVVVLAPDDVVADLDALIADEDRWARDELVDVVLVLVAERAPQRDGELLGRGGSLAD
jgi:hypothetical protein